MHPPLTFIILSSLPLLTLTLATLHDLHHARNADHSDGKCANGSKFPCGDSPLCFYDYAPFVGSFTCQGGTPNWDYCDAAIDVVCSTLAFNISASDADPYQSNIGVGTLEGQGADCFAQASNGENAPANLEYDTCVQKFSTIKGCENNRSWRSFDQDCVGGTYNMIINGLAAGKKVDSANPTFVLGTTGAFFTKDGAPQAGPAPGLKGGTSEDAGPSERPNGGGKPLATSSDSSPANAAAIKSGAGRAISAGRGVYLGAG
ncbi:MAG: hypothetical protein Q9220_006074 [cf. Caloplaca sp. 1 TL-2023]